MNPNSVKTGPPSIRPVLQFILGQAQIMGATITLVLLLTMGAAAPVFWVAGLTALATLASVLIFRVFWKP